MNVSIGRDSANAKYVSYFVITAGSLGKDILVFLPFYAAEALKQSTPVANQTPVHLMWALGSGVRGSFDVTPAAM
jgi:peroxiredoxin family protein